MNFKTTLVLIVLLAAAGIALFATRDRGGEPSTDTTGDGQKLIDVDRELVTRVTVAPSVGEKFTLEKSGSDWRLSEPVTAGAESFEVDALLRAVTEARSQGALGDADAKSDATGLSTPSYRVDLASADGKTHTLNVGAKTAVGGTVYVSTGEGGEVHVTPATLVEQLDKPASEYRKTQLVEVPSTSVKQLTVRDKEGKVALRAEQHGQDWQIVEPAKMPAEKSEVDDLIFAATGLRAVEFVSEDTTADAAKYQLDAPRLTVALSTEPPATQPTTAPATQGAATAATAATTTIAFGRYDDVLRKNVYATVSGSKAVAKVAATVLESFNKKPLDLRDRRAVNIDPEQVSKLSFTAELAATTQPTSRPASKREVAVQRRAEAAVLGPVVPATAPTPGPATTPATTQAATPPTPPTPPTQPAQDVAKWELVSEPKGEAADAKVDAILNALHPLRAQKYLEAVPTTQAAPAATYAINVTTEPAGGAAPMQHQVRLTDRGNDQPLVGEYNGLAFEVDRAILRQLEGEFTKGAAPAAPAVPAGGNEPNIPFPIGQ